MARDKTFEKIVRDVRDGKAEPFEDARQGAGQIRPEEMKAGRKLIEIIGGIDAGRLSKAFDAISKPLAKWATPKMQKSMDAAQAIGRSAARGDLEDRTRLRSEVNRGRFGGFGALTIAEAGLTALRGAAAGIGAYAVYGAVVAGAAALGLAVPALAVAIPAALGVAAAATGAVSVGRAKQSAMALGFFKERVRITEDAPPAELPKDIERAVKAARTAENSLTYDLDGTYSYLVVPEGDDRRDPAFIAERDFRKAVLPENLTDDYGRALSLTGDEVPAVIVHNGLSDAGRRYEPALVRPSLGEGDSLANRLIPLGEEMWAVMPREYIDHGTLALYADTGEESGADRARSAAMAYLERQFGVDDVDVPVPQVATAHPSKVGPLLADVKEDAATNTVSLLFSQREAQANSYGETYQPVLVDEAKRPQQSVAVPGSEARNYGSLQAALSASHDEAMKLAGERVRERIPKDALDIIAPSREAGSRDGIAPISDAAMEIIRAGKNLDEIEVWTPELFQEIGHAAYHSLREFRDSLRAIYSMMNAPDDMTPESLLDLPEAMDRLLPLLTDTAGCLRYDPGKGLSIEFNDRAGLRLLDAAEEAAATVKDKGKNFRLHGAYAVVSEIGTFDDLGADYRWYKAPKDSGLTGRDLPVVLEHRNQNAGGAVYYEPAMMTLPTDAIPATLRDLQPLGTVVGDDDGISLFRDPETAKAAAVFYMRSQADPEAYDDEYAPLPSTVVERRSDLGPLLVNAQQTERNHLMMTFMKAQNQGQAAYDPGYLGYQVSLADMAPDAPFRSVVVPHRHADISYPQQFVMEKLGTEILVPSQFDANMRLRAAQDEIQKAPQLEHRKEAISPSP